MNKCVVIAANNKILTFEATLIAIKNKWENENSHIKKIVLIRTLSEEEKKTPTLCKEKCESILPYHDQYEEKRIKTINDYYVDIPILFKDLVDEFSSENIIIDLTNGTKTFTDFAYLACTLLDINNVFRVKINREVYENKSIDTYKQVSINNEIVLSRDDLKSFINKTYSEYIFYYKEVEEIAKWIPKLSSKLDSKKFMELMLNVFEQYVNKNYDGSIIKLSTEIEYILDIVLEKLKLKFDQDTWNWLIGNDSFKRSDPNNKKNKSKVSSLGNKALTLANILNRANKIISKIDDKTTRLKECKYIKQNKDIYEFSVIIPIGYTLQSMAQIRNYSGHKNEYSIYNRTEVDARYQINAAIYVLQKMKRCKLLGGE